MASPVDGGHDNISFHSSDEERDGRFHGPDSSWRFYTKDERALADSLDQIENNDLSAHLYNTHQLKCRLYGDSSTLSSWQSKQKWLARDETGRIPFHPDRTWTAWPLEPADVPRSSEQWGLPVADEDDSTTTYRRSEVWRPSLHLHDCLQAEILRQAKERFRRRDLLGGQFTLIAQESRSYQDTGSVTSDEVSDAATSTSESRTRQQESAEHSGRADARPSFTADEDVAANILRPAVCHVISTLDDVLLGLHHSRRGHHRAPSQSRTRSPASHSASRASRNDVWLDSTAQQQTRSDRLIPQDQDPSKPAEQSSRQASSRDHPKRQELGTRDWSEVLGIAALVGWDQSIIARATTRCTALFDERMSFRVMPDTSAGKERENGLQTQQTPITREKFDQDMPTVDEGTNGHYCPYPSCARHFNAYVQMWRLREHLKRKHKHTAAEIRDLVGDEAGSTIASSSPSGLADKGSRDLQMAGTATICESIAHDEYLQPVTINIGRSKDRRLRRTPSRKHLRVRRNGTDGEETTG